MRLRILLAVTSIGFWSVSGASADFFEQHMELAIGYDSVGDFSAAITEFEQALLHATPEQKEEVYFRRAGAHFKRNDFEEAINDFIAAIEINPENGMHYLMRGVSYGMMVPENKPRACADLEAAVEIGGPELAFPGYEEWCAGSE